MDLNLQSQMVIDTLETVFTGSIFAVLSLIAWRGSAFVQWVRCEIGFLRGDISRVDRDNVQAHHELGATLGSIDARVGAIERGMNGHLRKKPPPGAAP